MPRKGIAVRPELVEFRKELAKRITSALETSGVTKADLARACGVTPPTVTGWCNGDTGATAENLAQIALTTRTSGAFLLPSPIPGLEGIEQQLNKLGSRLGPGRVKLLLEMPESRVLHAIDAAIGAYVSEREVGPKSPAQRPRRHK